MTGPTARGGRTDHHPGTLDQGPTIFRNTPPGWEVPSTTSTRCLDQIPTVSVPVGNKRLYGFSRSPPGAQAAGLRPVPRGEGEGRYRNGLLTEHDGDQAPSDPPAGRNLRTTDPRSRPCSITGRVWMRLYVLKIRQLTFLFYICFRSGSATRLGPRDTALQGSVDIK